MSPMCPHAGLEFELQRRLDDALNSLTVLDENDTITRTYWHGQTEGLAGALGALRGTNASMELGRSSHRLDRGDQ